MLGIPRAAVTNSSTMIRLDESSARVTRGDLQSPILRRAVVAELLAGLEVPARVQPETPFYSRLHQRRHLRKLERHFTNESRAASPSFANIFCLKLGKSAQIAMSTPYRTTCLRSANLNFSLSSAWISNQPFSNVATCSRPSRTPFPHWSSWKFPSHRAHLPLS